MLLHDTFAMVHVQKTGGSSIEAIVAEKFPDCKNGAEMGVARHAWFRQWSTRASGRFTFGFVRNPWDRLVSWFCMMRTNVLKNPLADHFRASTPDEDEAKAFVQFIELCDRVFMIQDAPYSFALPQVMYLQDNSGKLVSFVGKFERLEADIHYVFQKLGKWDVEIPHINSTEHGHYRDYYTHKTRRIVETRFAADIRLFDYRF